MPNKLISVLIPCKNRTYDLKEIMPSLMLAAEKSPPVEIVVVDYGSEDDLEEYISTLDSSLISYYKYDYPYYHIAHAYNLAAKKSKGDILVVLGADIMPDETYFEVIRSYDADWIHGPDLIGALAIKRDVFMDAGGYDERFEFYGPEDKDLESRLKRRGHKLALHPKGLLTEIYTEVEDKLKNYRPISRIAVKRAQHAIYFENIKNNVLVANEGKEWGTP